MFSVENPTRLSGDSLVSNLQAKNPTFASIEMVEYFYPFREIPVGVVNADNALKFFWKEMVLDKLPESREWGMVLHNVKKIDNISKIDGIGVFVSVTCDLSVRKLYCIEENRASFMSQVIVWDTLYDVLDIRNSNGLYDLSLRDVASWIITTRWEKNIREVYSSHCSCKVLEKSIRPYNRLILSRLVPWEKIRFAQEMSSTQYNPKMNEQLKEFVGKYVTFEKNVGGLLQFQEIFGKYNILVNPETILANVCNMIVPVKNVGWEGNVGIKNVVRKYDSAEEFSSLPRLKHERLEKINEILSIFPEAVVLVKEKWGDIQFKKEWVKKIEEDFVEIPIGLKWDWYREKKEYAIHHIDGSMRRYNDPVFTFDDWTVSQLEKIWRENS